MIESLLLTLKTCGSLLNLPPKESERKGNEEMMSWHCIFHGHEIIRYDRELAWECIACLKRWPMAAELVRASGVYAQKGDPLREPVQRYRKADQERAGFFQEQAAAVMAISSHVPGTRA